ncbi:hypothetical protein JCM8547_009297 [Rhodosporidiobolus lusitaniae]
MDPDPFSVHPTSAAPSPASSSSQNGGFALDPSFSHLQDLLASNPTLFPFANSVGTPGGSTQDASGYAASPSAGAGATGGGAPIDFNDLLAQFTLPTGSVFSPAATGAATTGAVGEEEAGSEQAKSPDQSGLMAMLEMSMRQASNERMGNGSTSGGKDGAAFALNPNEVIGGRTMSEAVMEQFHRLMPGALAGGAGSPSAAGGQGQSGQANPASNGTGETPQQLPTYAPTPGVDVQQQLQQLLAQSLGMGSGTPTPTGPPPTQQGAPFYPPPHLQQGGASFPPQSPNGYQQHPSQPGSAVASPMPSYHGTQQQQQQQYNSPYQQATNPAGPFPPSVPQQSQTPQPPQQQSQIALPPNLQNLLPLVGMPGADQQNTIFAQAQLAALQLLMNAQAQANAQQAQQAQQQQQQQAAAQLAHAQAVAAAQVQLQQQQQQQHQQQQQQHQQQNGVHAGLPQSNGTSIDGSYREHEYIFSPLMSPAMTPHSVFTNASSLPPSVGPVPLVSPSDFFPPLTSPALGPQLYSSDAAARLHGHRHSLQGLVDGVGALSTHLPPGSASPIATYYSPRLGPSDAGSGTGAGAGRRGAGASKKTRPSPLIKPTDPALERRRKKAAEKRGSVPKSVTSSPFLGPSPANGGSLNGGQGSNAGYGEHVRAASVNSGTSSKPSPPEMGNGQPGPQYSSASAAGSIDTPSPVELSAAVVSAPSAAPDSFAIAPLAPSQSLQAQMINSMLQQQQQEQSAKQQFADAAMAHLYQHELMGPPPLPTSSSASSSATLAAPASNGNNAPVTPASFMNFSSDFHVDTLSALSGHPQHQHYDSLPGSAFSSVQNSPALLPQDGMLPLLPQSAYGHLGPEANGNDITIAPPALKLGGGADELMSLGESFLDPNTALPVPPPVPSTSSSSSAQSGKTASSSTMTKRKSTASAKASPALKPSDPKGKGKAAAMGGEADGAKAGGRKKPQKIAPSPRIGPSPKIRPLLASAAPDAEARLTAKTNYENVMDGHGGLIGLPQSTQSELQAQAAPHAPTPSTSSSSVTTAAKAAPVAPDNRRSSHKVAEQKRRDSLKMCFDELRIILPPILPYTDESDRRPGDGNVGGQRHGEVDPNNPNKGVSKVALLRRSNEYLIMLRERIDRRDQAISALRRELASMRSMAGLGEVGEEEEEVPGLDLDLDSLDKEEKAAGNIAFYENLDFTSSLTPIMLGRKPSRRSASAAVQQQQLPNGGPATRRRTTRTSQAALQEEAMEVEVGGEEQ